MRNVALSVVVVAALASASLLSAAEFSWQKAHVKILPNGDMQWQPEPFEFRAGESVRYIDYEGGDDSAAGTSKQTAWKHHPWDRDATGKAAECSGVHTYVFKRGVVYRGQLYADESGTPDEPIRLTSDPSWGRGEARMWGSVKLPGEWVKASTVEAPRRLPEKDKVWAIDLSKLGIAPAGKGIDYKGPNPEGGGGGRPGAPFTGLFVVRPDGSAGKVHLARWPDWQKGSDNFAMDYWHSVDGGKEVTVNGVRAGGLYDEVLKGHPEDWFTGGTIWIGYRSLMGTPTPATIPAERQVKRGGKTVTVPYYHPDEGVLLKGAQGGYGKGGLRYLIENLPQFLDADNEFYLDEASGMLYYRPAGGANPNRQHLELTHRVTQIAIPSRSHIEISGLSFSFAHGATIDMEDDVTDVDIHHCTFHNIPSTGISGGVSRSDETLHVMDRIRVADCDFRDVWTTAVSLRGEWIWNKAKHRGRLGHVEILRNNVYNTGMRHSGSRWSNVPAMSFNKLQTGQIAGNIVRRSMGSGIVILGGKEGNLGPYDARDADLPLIRILVHHNKTEDTALGVNDYGGLALWQGGPTYCYNNLIGNSPGHMPSGFFGMTHPINLSYPLYLDGAFKQYCFNNIIWGRTVDTSDPFANTTPGYFQVFGFLNHFANNTIYRNAKGVGGSSGNRCDIVSNVFDGISNAFLANNREGDPSLVGGGDDASSGIRGIPSLAFARNYFHGRAEAGALLKKERRGREAMDKSIEAETIDEMARQMREFPIRVPDLGKASDRPLIQGAPDDSPIDELTSAVDFRPAPASPAVDAGATYFVPWSLKATVGEWHFNANHARPDMVTDYHWYMSEAHFHRSMYEYIPSFDLRLSDAKLSDYVESPSETWVKGAMAFDGKRSASYPDKLLREDIVISLGSWDRSNRRRRKPPEAPWTVDKPSRGKRYAKDDVMRYPGKLRKTLVISTQNLLIEANLRIDRGTNGAILAKHDGKAGYRLACNEAGKAEFTVSSDGRHATVASSVSINDGRWHHVLAEIDRGTGRMTVYVDGEASGQAKASLAATASIDTRADVVVGKSTGLATLRGAIDFLRVCRSTLADSRTSIEELHAWQTAGPVTRDFRGRRPRGRRDAGAMERVD